jgi:hypothetical protein
MATALSYPTISGVSGAPYLSALTDTANIQDTINYLYYGSTKAPVVTDGVYGMLTKLQTQITGLQTGINVHESAKWATTTTLAAVYAAGTADASGGTGISATITFSATGVQKIDSTTTNIALNDRILVKDGTTALSGTTSVANGVYYVTTVPAVGVAGILTRALDSDNSVAGEMSEGDFLYVTDGDSNANEAYMLTTTSATGTNPSGGQGAIKIGTDPVTFTQFIGVGSYYIGTTAAQITSVNQALTGISSIAMASAGGGTFTLTPASSASSFAITIPAAADTLVGKATTDTLTNKTLSDSTTWIVDAADNTKRVNIDVTGTTGITGVLQTAFTTAKTIAFPDTAGTVYVSNGTDVTLADGGTNASLTASNGGIVYSTASAMAILAGVATAGKHLQSGVSTTPSWTTSTYADTYAVNTILYAGTANTVSGLATANSGVLVTSASGVPSISTTIPAVTLTTPTVDTINTSFTTTGTAALWNTGLTTGTISIAGALTSGTLNIGSGTAGAKTINIGTSTGRIQLANILNTSQTANTTASLTITGAVILAKTITQSGQTTATTYTLDTGANLDTTFGTPGSGTTIDWQIFNDNTSTGIISIISSTGHTTSGTTTVPIGAYAKFTTRRTATTGTYITYRTL